MDSLGYFHIVGEVVNSGDVWLQFIKITGTLRNANGQIVDVTTTYAYATYLPPNGKSPFDLLESDTAKSSTITTYTLADDYEQASSTPGNTLVIEDATRSTDSLGEMNILGQIRNKGQATSNFTKVYATYYDHAGRVIYVDFAYTSPSDIPPGQAYSFKITGPNATITSHVANYALLAESDHYTSVPEFRWPPILTAAALTLAVVAIRRKKLFEMREHRNCSELNQ